MRKKKNKWKELNISRWRRITLETNGKEKTIRKTQVDLLDFPELVCYQRKSVRKNVPHSLCSPQITKLKKSLDYNITNEQRRASGRSEHSSHSYRSKTWRQTNERTNHRPETFFISSLFFKPYPRTEDEEFHRLITILQALMERLSASNTHTRR